MSDISNRKLNANQLKFIAIIAMTIDHIAWGFVDMFSVLGQTMHVIGRLTIPIMCFFIAEGYKKTSDLKRYIYRMMTFSVITFFPFLLFFGEEYGYRQNIIFDYMLALLALSIVASEKLEVWKKVLAFTGVVLVSAVFGGWPILPIALVLIFYYVKSPKKQFALMFGAICLVELAVFLEEYLENTYHIFNYSWRWYEYFYFFGFLLAIPLINMYSGEKGKNPLGRYFFFIYYPMHFCILYAIKCIMLGNYHELYLNIHIMCLVLIICFTVLIVRHSPSEASITCIIMGASGAIYTFGFIMEILYDDLSFAYAGVIIEYFGECILFIAFLRFISLFCKKNTPKLVYGISGIISSVILYCLMTTQENHIFYKDMRMDYSGPFPRISLDYGWGYYIFVVYMVMLCGGAIFICLQTIIKSHGIERKRVESVVIAIMCPWVAFAIWMGGFTGGYEIAVLGTLGALYSIYRAIVKFGYFDSIQLAQANALYHFKEGILVVDNKNVVSYINDPFKMLFSENEGEAVRDEVLVNMISGKLSKYECDGRIYDVEKIPLIEKGYTQGQMLYLHDMTDHYMRLEMAEHYANTDALTGLFNRKHFISCFIDYRRAGGVGTMLMFDLDNFKGVNDNLGHDTGDLVLKTLAETLEANKESRHYTCRIGGDEFVMFLKDKVSKEDVSDICKKLITEFSDNLAKKGKAGITSISVGAKIVEDKNTDSDEKDFVTNYKLADAALYEAKTSGKATYRLA